MQRMLLVASVLVFLVGISLYLLTERTDRYFAWTIANPLTAAFLGAGYWASGVLEFAASRERTWRNARIAVPSVLLFTCLTLVVTLVHRDRFHFDDPRFITQAGTWFWLAVYTLVPLIMGVIFLRTGWKTGEPPRDEPLSWARYVFLLQGLIMGALGVALLVIPLDAAEVWPWALTALTARAIGAWLLSLGVAALHVAWENSLRATRAALYAYVALGILQLVAVSRYSDGLDWQSANTYLYVAFVGSMLVVGGVLVAKLHWRAADAT
jgi:hypothetical protein